MVDVTSHKAGIYAGFGERNGLAFDDKKGHVSRRQSSLLKLLANVLLQRGSGLRVVGGSSICSLWFWEAQQSSLCYGVRGGRSPHRVPLFQRGSTTTAPGWATAWGSATTATSMPSSSPSPS